MRARTHGFTDATGIPMFGWINYALVFFAFFSFSLSTRHASFPSALDHATRLVFILPTLSLMREKKSNTSAVPVRKRERERDERGEPRDAGREPLLNEIHTCRRAGNGVSTLSPRWQPLNYNWTRRWSLFFEFIQIREIKRRRRGRFFGVEKDQSCVSPERLMGQPVNMWHMLLTRERLGVSYA